MDIVVDSCSYNCQNVGDLAMLTVAVSRLRELFPLASIRVITNAPERIARHCGTVETIPKNDEDWLKKSEYVIGGLSTLTTAVLVSAWVACPVSVTRAQ